MRLSVGLRIWFAAFLVCTVLVGFSFAYLDLTVAEYFRFLTGRLDRLGDRLGSAVLLSFEAAALLVLAVLRIRYGHVSRFGATLAVALLTSMCAYAVNSTVLKVFFGVPSGWELAYGARHAFALFLGTPGSSFPSGHMALAGAFAGVFFRIYRHSVLPLGLFLAFAALLLVAGGWHYVSDVIAGGFLGVSAGLLAAEVWQRHEAAHQ